MILCDTDVYIEYFKGKANAKSVFDKIGVSNIAISAVTVMELYYGALNARELAKIKEAISTLRLVLIDAEVCQEAIDLMERYSKSHGLRIPDALIAATAITHSSPLLTYNSRDFQFIADVQLYH